MRTYTKKKHTILVCLCCCGECVYIVFKYSFQFLETLGPWAQSSSDSASRRRARIGYGDDDDQEEEWRGWRGVETSWSGRLLTEGYNDLTTAER